MAKKKKSNKKMAKLDELLKGLHTAPEEAITTSPPRKEPPDNSIFIVSDKEERRTKSEQPKKDRCEEDTEEGTPKEELTSTYISRDRRNIEKR